MNVRCLGITDAKSQRFHCYVWSEIDSGKSPSEVITCFQDLLETTRVTSKYCIITSDNAPGEMKNNIFNWWLQSLIDKNVFLRIDYKTLLSGHSYSCCDRHFGVIERKLKIHDNIETPSDYVNIIKQASIDGKYQAKIMTYKDFHDYKTFLNNEFTYKYIDINGDKFEFEKCHNFNYGIGERGLNGVVSTYSHPTTIWARKTFDPKEIPQVLDFRKQKQRRPLSACRLHSLNERQRPLSLKTFKDINELARAYLSPRAQQFYSEVPNDKTED